MFCSSLNVLWSQNKANIPYKYTSSMKISYIK